PTLRHGTVGSPAPGANNANGEHGSNAPVGPTNAPDPGETLSGGSWENGKTIDHNVNVAQGQTVQIAPGAVITVSAGVAITVTGTLKVASEATHAKLTGPKWTGIVVAAGGTLDTKGLDLDNATTALWTQKGNAAATFANGTIKASTPFTMEAGSKLSIVNSTVNATAGSAIAGNFAASHMTYDKGTAGGLTIND